MATTLCFFIYSGGLGLFIRAARPINGPAQGAPEPSEIWRIEKSRQTIFIITDWLENQLGRKCSIITMTLFRWDHTETPVTGGVFHCKRVFEVLLQPIAFLGFSPGRVRRLLGERVYTDFIRRPNSLGRENCLLLEVPPTLASVYEILLLSKHITNEGILTTRGRTTPWERIWLSENLERFFAQGNDCSSTRSKM